MTVNAAAAPAKGLDASSSIFLDAMRLGAALIVLGTHARGIWFGTWESDLLASHLSHGAVVIFFVLSGYVISYTTSANQRNHVEYAAARLGRLYSIFLPALLFAIVCSLLASVLNPAIFDQYSRGHDGARYFVSLFFCNELWFFSAAPLIIGPIWSLGYEFWFYAIFGCWIYRFKGGKGFLLPIAALLVAGPKIALMLPIWLMGAMAYKLPKPRLSGKTLWLLIGLLTVCSLLLMVRLPSWPSPVDTPPLIWAAQFISDGIVGFFIALAFWLLPLSALARDQPARKRILFRKFADLTFPIYVLHFPCLVLCRAVIPQGQNMYANMVAGFLITLLVCSVLGFLLEKTHPWWKRSFKKIISRCQEKFGAVSRQATPTGKKA